MSEFSIALFAPLGFVDRNRDNKISKPPIFRMSCNGPEAEDGGYVRSADSDSDGDIDVNEAIQYYLTRNEKKKEEELKYLATQLDHDPEGVLALLSNFAAPQGGLVYCQPLDQALKSFLLSSPRKELHKTAVVMIDRLFDNNKDFLLDAVFYAQVSLDARQEAFRIINAQRLPNDDKFCNLALASDPASLPLLIGENVLRFNNTAAIRSRLSALLAASSTPQSQRQNATYLLERINTPRSSSPK